MPETQYTKSGGINIAYQVAGEGPLDLVYVPGWVSNDEECWEEPTLEERMDDVRAVMDAAGSGRAALFGFSEGGNLSVLFAATYPERTAALVTFGIFAKRVRSPDYPWAPTLEERERDIELTEQEWGREMDTAGDGFLATFDGPARAIRCGFAVADDARRRGLEVRAGVHTGECELLGDKVAGIAVHTGARVAALAGGGEVLVSQTVKDLVAGSGPVFQERGEHEF